MRVYEKIEDASGTTWYDASSWYWDALFQRSKGPWVATTLFIED
jgi:hypothetical protein